MSALPAPLLEPQLLDLRGRPLRDLRLSVIEACNFRCGYCMPADKVPDDYGFDTRQRLDFDQIETLVRSAARLGVHKLRITGGEPLLRKHLPDLIARLTAIPGIDDIAMTTNGVLLPRFASALRAAGLHRLTVSLDALGPDLYHHLSGGRGRVSDVLAGIAAAEAAGFSALKINCVVQRGVNDHEVFPLLQHFRHSGHIVRFIEYMDVGTCNNWQPGQVLTSKELYTRIHARWPLIPLQENYRGEVAERHAFADGGGEIGFISSISNPFCGDCHRSRVSADGTLYTCLFSSKGHDLKNILAQGELNLADHLAELWATRKDRYSELRGSAVSGRSVTNNNCLENSGAPRDSHVRNLETWSPKNSISFHIKSLSLLTFFDSFVKLRSELFDGT